MKSAIVVALVIFKSMLAVTTATLHAQPYNTIGNIKFEQVFSDGQSCVKSSHPNISNAIFNQRIDKISAQAGAIAINIFIDLKLNAIITIQPISSTKPHKPFLIGGIYSHDSA